MIIDYESEAYSVHPTLRYPLSSEERSNSFIDFEIIETIPPSFSLDFSSAFQWKETGRIRSESAAQIKKLDNRATGRKVKLYVPQSHAISETFGYQTADLGVAGGALAGSMEQGGDVTSAASAAFKQGFQGISNLVNAFNGTDLGRLGIVRGAAAAPVGNSVRNAISVTARTSLHPNTRAVFERPNIRKFNFLFKFIPSSKEESDQVKEIIHYFRYNSYPEQIDAGVPGSNFSTPVGYEFPNMFRIKLYSKVGDTYKRIGSKMLDCFCEGITTTYNPQASVFHPDGSPVEIDLNLNFMEHRAMSRNDLEGASAAKKTVISNTNFRRDNDGNFR